MGSGQTFNTTTISHLQDNDNNSTTSKTSSAQLELIREDLVYRSVVSSHSLFTTRLTGCPNTMAQILLYISALLHNVHVQSHPFRWTDQQCQPVFVHRFPNTSSCEPMATHLNTPFRDHLNWLRLTPLFALGPGNYLELVGVRCMPGMIPISNIGCHLRSGEWIMEILDKRQTLCHPPWYKLIRPRSNSLFISHY